MQVTPGVVLGTRYRVQRMLGRGGMADVYAATDEVLARQVAVKVFRPEVDIKTGEARQQLEIRTLAQLTHPNIVTLYDAGDDDGTSYVVMQLVEGPTLAERCRASALEPDEAARVGTAVADALAHVHGRGIVHRDVKPANVLLGTDGTVFLTDFGIVRLVGMTRLTATGTVGTASYLAPEQVHGQDVTPASDVYALGLVLLECLTGAPEYPGSSVESAVARLSRPPRVPERLSPEWRDLLVAMTADEPAQRPPAGEVALRLRALADASPTVATARLAEQARPSEGTRPDGTRPDGTRPLTALPTSAPTRVGAALRSVPRRVRVLAATLGVVLMAVVLAAVLAGRGTTDAPAEDAGTTAPPGPERLEQDLRDLEEAVQP